MSFPEYLNSKQGLIIVWLLLHGFIVFMNYSGTSANLGQNNSPDFTQLHLPGNEKPDEKLLAEQNFWPFVQFNTVVREYDFNENGPCSNIVYSHFNGLFYQYDLTEFMGYLVLLFILLYLRWVFVTFKPRHKSLELWRYGRTGN